MNLNLALQLLRGQSTLEFLKSNFLSISGTSTAGQNTFALFQTPRSASDKRERFRISKKTTPPIPGGVEFEAYNIPMINADNVASHGAITGNMLPTNGVNVMVTGMLTACSFAYNSDKNNMQCFHMQPSATATGANKGIALGTNLLNGGNFVGANGKFLVFTHRDYATCSSATVIGIRRLDGWSLYAQGVDGPTADVKFAVQLI